MSNKVTVITNILFIVDERMRMINSHCCLISKITLGHPYLSLVAPMSIMHYESVSPIVCSIPIGNYYMKRICC